MEFFKALLAGAVASASGGGGSAAPLYMHAIQFRTANTYASNVYCAVVSERAEPFDLDSFGAYIREAGFVAGYAEGRIAYPCTGRNTSSSSIPFGVYWNPDTNILQVRENQILSGNMSYAFDGVSMLVGDTVFQIS